MSTALRPVRRIHLAFGALLGLAVVTGCNPEPEQPLLSIPEPRVATYTGSGWEIEPRPDDSFSTWNSMFASGPDGRPYAMRQVGTRLQLGVWNGQDWEIETVENAVTQSFPSIDDDDQLYSGVLEVDGAGNAHAMFVTMSSDFFYVGQTAGEGGSSWVITELTSKLQKCYDLAVGADGRARLLYADQAGDGTYVAGVDAEGNLEPTLIRDESVCGTADVTTDATSGETKIGALLWVLSSDGKFRNGKLYEKKDSDSAWSVADVVTNGRNECYYCYVPQMAYRGDGVPVVMYVDSSISPYVASRLSDGSFSRRQLATGGQAFQLTGFKEGADGSLAAAIIVDASNIGLMLTRPGETSGPTLSLLNTAVDASTPRLAWTGTQAYLSYWSAEGLSSLLPTVSGVHTVSLIDADGGYGHVAGGFISISDDGQLQVFYNESHELED